MGKDNFKGDRNDIVITVIGQTGCGKSNFINKLVGSGEPPYSSTLKSVTQNVTPYFIDRGSSRIVLVDTPGFDDANRLDREVLSTVSDWLKQKYQSTGVKPAGIVYLHRITDNRSSGSVHKNPEVFGRLCGNMPLSRVRLVTTMWDQARNQEMAQNRETQLQRDFWNKVIDGGAVTKRFYNTRDSAWDIVEDLISLQRLRNETDESPSCLSYFFPKKSTN